jgi:hypothetical protein
MMKTPIRLVQLIRTFSLTAALAAIAVSTVAAWQPVTSPDGRLALILT